MFCACCAILGSVIVLLIELLKVFIKYVKIT